MLECSHALCRARNCVSSPYVPCFAALSLAWCFSGFAHCSIDFAIERWLHHPNTSFQAHLRTLLCHLVEWVRGVVWDWVILSGQTRLVRHLFRDKPSNEVCWCMDSWWYHPHWDIDKRVWLRSTLCLSDSATHDQTAKKDDPREMTSPRYFLDHQQHSAKFFHNHPSQPITSNTFHAKSCSGWVTPAQSATNKPAKNASNFRQGPTMCQNSATKQNNTRIVRPIPCDEIGHILGASHGDGEMRKTRAKWRKWGRCVMSVESQRKIAGSSDHQEPTK